MEDLPDGRSVFNQNPDSEGKKCLKQSEREKTKTHQPLRQLQDREVTVLFSDSLWKAEAPWALSHIRSAL